MTTVVPDRKGIRRLNKLEAAAIAQSWSGGAHPDDRPEIEREYAEARAAMVEHLNAQALAIVDLTERLASVLRQLERMEETRNV